MILFVILGIIFLRYVYSQIVVPPDVQLAWGRAIADYQQGPKSFVYADAQEPDLDLMYNKVIDLDEAFKC